MDTRRRKLALTAIAACAIITSTTSSVLPADIYYAQALKAILVRGAIATGDLERIEEVHQSANGPVESLYLHSPGGDFTTAIAVGYWVRQHHLTTYASKILCESACGFLWLAGERRFANGVVSLHMPFYRTSTVTIAIPEEGIANAAWYLASLGHSRQILDALLVVSLTESNQVFPITGPNTAIFQIAYDHFPREDLFKEATGQSQTPTPVEPP